MPEPTTTTLPDYSTLSKAQLLDELLKRDAALAAHDDAERVERARAEEAARKRSERGAPTLLGKIDVFDVDSPEDVLERAKAVRAGRIPIAMAKRFKSDARILAPVDSPLAKRLGKRDVPLGTEIGRDELPPQHINDLYSAGALIAIG